MLVALQYPWCRYRTVYLGTTHQWLSFSRHFCSSSILYSILCSIPLVDRSLPFFVSRLSAWLPAWLQLAPIDFSQFNCHAIQTLSGGHSQYIITKASLYEKTIPFSAMKINRVLIALIFSKFEHWTKFRYLWENSYFTIHERIQRNKSEYHYFWTA